MLLLILVLVLSTASLSNADNDDQYLNHQVYPSARFEHYTSNSNVLRTLDPTKFAVHYEGPPNTELFMKQAGERIMAVLFVTPDAPSYAPPDDDFVVKALSSLEVHVASNETQLHQDVDESYSLTIKETGNAVLSCETVFGALRGLETFAQLVEYGWTMNDASTTITFVIYKVPLYIKDRPEYSHRGLMIDTARHYLPLDLIHSTLDAMAMNKLNVLHWHMTDHESFPYLSKKHPELAQNGSYGPTRIYTTKDIETIVRQAYLRGIRVIPEFDMPGHTQAMGASHPELLSHCPDASSPLDPTNFRVYEFIKELYTEITELFVDDMIHVGGDEVSLDCWTLDESIQSWMKEHGVGNVTQLFEHFEGKLLDLVSNKNVIVWQEVFDLGLLTNRPQVIVDVWKGWNGYDVATIQKATEAHHKVLVSSCWYLDHLDQTFMDFYKCNPRNFTGSLTQKQLVVGGHASMWGERVDASNFESRVWPRASAAAEKLWSGESATANKSVWQRIQRFRCIMVGRGIMASPVGPGSCNVEPPFEPRIRLEKQLRGSWNTE